MTDTPQQPAPSGSTPPAGPVYGQPAAQPAAYGQPAYGQPAYGQPTASQQYAQQYGQYAAGPGGVYAPVAAPPTNGLAIAALVLSLVGVHLGGIVCGHIALGQIRQTGQGGRGLAIAGLVIGYVFAAFVVLTLLLTLFIFLVSGVFIFGAAASSG